MTVSAKLDAILSDGVEAVLDWQAAEARAEAARADATEALCEAIRTSPRSLRAIARRARVAPATLSQVMNGGLRHLSSATTRRVLDAIQDGAR